jgi:glutathione transport system substrate-binding protein
VGTDLLQKIGTVEAVDKYTLRVRLKEPSGALPTILAGYFRAFRWHPEKSFATYDKEWVHHPAGTGPYMFKEWVPGKHIILEKIPPTSSQVCLTSTPSSFAS